MFPDNFKPNLAATIQSTDQICFPTLVSRKLDGVRVIINETKAHSRTLKAIPNLSIQQFVQEYGKALQGIDGEVIVGEPNAEDALNKTTSGVMSQEGEPDFKLYIFDSWDLPGKTAIERYEETRHRVSKLLDTGKVVLVEKYIKSSTEELDRFEQEVLTQGYEGVMIQDPFSTYKYGRSTLREKGLAKIKRFVDTEVLIVGAEEMQHNTNEAQEDNFGRTKRSSAKEGMQPAGTLGKFNVKMLDGTDREFSVGCFKGFTKDYLKEIWDDIDSHVGKILKIKYFPIGEKDLPRLPVVLGFRDKIDI